MTQSELQSLVFYDPEMGIFTWLPRIGDKAFNARFAGKSTGTIGSTGHVTTQILGRKFTDHRLAFLYMKGGIPRQVGHANSNLWDNSWKNLLPHRKNGRPE
jgi:hypothetical protein